LIEKCAVGNRPDQRLDVGRHSNDQDGGQWQTAQRSREQGRGDTTRTPKENDQKLGAGPGAKGIEPGVFAQNVEVVDRKPNRRNREKGKAEQKADPNPDGAMPKELVGRSENHNAEHDCGDANEIHE